jgi:hypothetical protein
LLAVAEDDNQELSGSSSDQKDPDEVDTWLVKSKEDAG